MFIHPNVSMRNFKKVSSLYNQKIDIIRVKLTNPNTGRIFPEIALITVNSGGPGNPFGGHVFIYRKYTVGQAFWQWKKGHLIINYFTLTTTSPAIRLCEGQSVVFPPITRET